MPDGSGRSGVVDNLIVGSGLAGLAAGMALRARGVPFEVLDVGYDLDTVTGESVTELSRQHPRDWNSQTSGGLFPPPKASTSGVQRRLLFGSDFPYRIPMALKVRMENCATELTHGIGGFGNVWGAAMLPYSDHALRNWPIDKLDLDQSYRNVLRYVPLSGERDNLEVLFPIHTEQATRLERSPQIDALLKSCDQRKEKFSKLGVNFGRARVAVKSDGMAGACRYCGKCLDGCVYGAIFNPRHVWNELERSERLIHRGNYALEFKEHDDHVLVTSVGIEDGSIRTWRTRRLFLASGHFATARMIARSLGHFNETIRIADSQYFFFPLLSYKALREEARFSLAELFLEILNKDISDSFMHFQVYGMNEIFRQTLRSLIPAPLPISAITNRFYMFQGYLNSAQSGHLELEVGSASRAHDEIVIRGMENPAAVKTARKAQALLRKAFLHFGVIPPAYLKLVPPGRSFHTGGSFPMGGSHAVYSSDTLGRPAGLRRVHIVDSANFPDVASSTIGYTIMANADRIVRKCSELAA